MTSWPDRQMEKLAKFREGRDQVNGKVQAWLKSRGAAQD